MAACHVASGVLDSRISHVLHAAHAKRMLHLDRHVVHVSEFPHTHTPFLLHEFLYAEQRNEKFLLDFEQQ